MWFVVIALGRLDVEDFSIVDGFVGRYCFRSWWRGWELWWRDFKVGRGGI